MMLHMEEISITNLSNLSLEDKICSKLQKSGLEKTLYFSSFISIISLKIADLKNQPRIVEYPKLDLQEIQDFLLSFENTSIISA